MPEPMGLREFGRFIDLSGEAIRKAIKTGRIPANLIGEITLGSGRTRPVIKDPEAARAAMDKNTSPNYRQDSAAISRGRAAVGRGVSGIEAQQAAAPVAAPAGGGSAPSIVQSRAITEAYKARLAKLEYEEKSGKLVNADEVKIRLSGMVSTARSRLLGVPSKAKGRIPHLTVDEIALLDELVREALEDVAVGS